MDRKEDRDVNLNEVLVFLVASSVLREKVYMGGKFKSMTIHVTEDTSLTNTDH